MHYGKFTAKNVEDLQKLLKDYCDKLGLTRGIDFKISGAKYNDVFLSFKVNAVINNEGIKNAITLEKKRVWEKHCGELGLSPTDFGRVVKVKGRAFKVCGLNVGRKLVHLEEVSNEGKVFMCTPTDFRRMQIGED